MWSSDEPHQTSCTGNFGKILDSIVDLSRLVPRPPSYTLVAGSRTVWSESLGVFCGHTVFLTNFNSALASLGWFCLQHGCYFPTVFHVCQFVYLIRICRFLPSWLLDILVVHKLYFDLFFENFMYVYSIYVFKSSPHFNCS